MTVRKRLRLLPLVIALVAGLLGATAPLAQAVAPAVVYGSGSCVGADACTGAAGPIGDNSCIGDYSCSNSTGAIGNDSCNGELSCSQAKSVGDGSCNGQQACAFATASVGSHSCNGDYVCQNRHSAVGDCQANSVPQAVCTQPDARIRRVGRHNLVGNDIYNTDATDQTLNSTLKPDGKVRFSITIQNDADVEDSFTVGAQCGIGADARAIVGEWVGTGGIAFKLVTGRPGQDITSNVLSDSYVTRTVPPDGKFRLRAVIKPGLSPTALGSAVAARLTCLITATSVGNPANADAVRFIVNYETTPI
jgi:hypothetical protein